MYTTPSRGFVCYIEIVKRTPLKRTGFKKKPTKKVSKPKRPSPRLGINLNAKSPTYKEFGGGSLRYNGIKGVAWQILSKYIRKRDGYKCVTCGNDTILAQQAGHYWPIGFVGSNNKLSWDEMNIHCQCKRCNEDAGGLQKVMADYIDREYGVALRESLDQRRWKTDPIDNWEDVVIHYEEKLRALGGV